MFLKARSSISPFPDVNLEPYMMYEYRISAWNSYGRGFSKAIRARTKEDVPEGLSAPRWTKMDNLEDVILLSWKKPIQSNGIKLLFKLK